MPINPKLQTILAKLYTPDSSVDLQYHGKDITILTNENGEAVTLFIGKRNEDGTITGERYARKFKTDSKTGKRSSHWDLKGKASRR
jgi:hypothetical protein